MPLHFTCAILKTTLWLFSVHIVLEVYDGEEMNPESEHSGSSGVTLLAIRQNSASAAGRDRLHMYLCSDHDDRRALTVQVSDSTEERSNRSRTFSLSPICSHFYSARNARIASAVLAPAIPSVRLSVRLSHEWYQYIGRGRLNG